MKSYLGTYYGYDIYETAYNRIVVSKYGCGICGNFNSTEEAIDWLEYTFFDEEDYESNFICSDSEQLI